MPSTYPKAVVVFNKEEQRVFKSIRDACLTMHFTREVMRWRIADGAALKGGWRVRYATEEEKETLDED